jgi:predicted TIM-barrel fold metal-dependent hydrolase
MAAAICEATNRWTAEAWLDADDRLRGSIVIGPRDPKLAAAEVRRCAEDPRFVQVLLAYPQAYLGDRTLHPIYVAATEAGLPVTLQAGGAFAGANKGNTFVGFPTTTFEHELAATYTAQPHALSLLLNGVFDRFPQLRVVFSGFGSAWLAPLVWRLERELAQGRLERPPGLQRRPAEYVADHLRVTTAPLDLPSDPAAAENWLALSGTEALAMFASGVLGDRPQDLAAAPQAVRQAVLEDNAAALYGLAAVPV